jgi:hypothetical protein
MAADKAAVEKPARAGKSEDPPPVSMELLMDVVTVSEKIVVEDKSRRFVGERCGSSAVPETPGCEEPQNS